jgi:hypothetical protein
MTSVAIVKQRAEGILAARNRTRNEITEKEWKDAVYQAWLITLEEETNKLLKVYQVLAGESE